MNTNSKSAAGGVGLYVSEELEFTRRCDFNLCQDGVESCWIELPQKRQKSVMIGCIYRHPSSHRGSFYEALKPQLERLNNKEHEVFVLGAININFLKYNDDSYTSDYLDMLLDLSFMPLITKATRITNYTSTLIDHIYTNVPEKINTAGICLADISDHLPIFCSIANKLPITNEIKYFRDFSKFDNEAFLNALANVDFRSLVTTDVNESMHRVTETLQQISDLHAPVRKVSNKKRKQLKKPWISNAIMTSIKKKQKLFKTHFLSNDQDKIKEYKLYCNKLNKVKELAKKNYFRTTLGCNLKTTWKLIGVLVNKKSNSQVTIKKLLCDNKCYTHKVSIARKLNNYYINEKLQKACTGLPVVRVTQRTAVFQLILSSGGSLRPFEGSPTCRTSRGPLAHTFNYFVMSCPILRSFSLLSFCNKFSLKITKHALK